MIRAQGGDPDAELPRARHVETISTPTTGVLTTLDAYRIGLAACWLGAGRARKEDSVDHAAGVRCLVEPGERVSAGAPLLQLHTDRPETFSDASAALEGGYEISGADAKSTPLILDRITP